MTWVYLLFISSGGKKMAEQLGILLSHLEVT
jgi:hypothetical protein